MIEWIIGNACSPEEEELVAQVKEVYVKQRHKAAIEHLERGYRTYIGKPRKYIQRKTRDALIAALYDYYREQERPTVTLGQALDEFIKYKKDIFGVDPGTIMRNGYSARFFEGIADKPLQDLTTDDIRLYIRGKTFKEYEIKAAVQLLHGVYKWAIGKGLVKDDPSYPIEPREFFQIADRTKKTANEKIFRPLDIERIKAAMRRELPNMRAFGVLLSIETGMRSGELVSLKWDDIKAGAIHIHTQQKLLLDDQGHRIGFKELPYTKDERKHPHDGRLFPLSDEIRAILDELRPFTGNGTYLLEEEGHWISKTSYEKYLQRHLHALGYGITNNHAFRMSLNSNVLIPAGLTPSERAYILGHSVETNERYYSYIRSEQIDSIREKLGAAVMQESCKNQSIM